MIAPLRSLWAALGFLTVLPVPPLVPRDGPDRELFGRAFAWYPAVGLLMGGALAAGGWLLGRTALGVDVRAGLLLLLWVLLTGGLHLDGLADSCDGLLAPVSPPRRLAILADVHVGAFGVTGLVLLLGLKWALLAELLDRPGWGAALLLAPLWGRWMLVVAAQRFPYARAESESSLGRVMRRGLTRRQTAVATATALGVQAGLAFGRPSLLGAVAGPLVGLLLARWAAARLGGGLTGDVYGGLCEVVEAAVLLGVVLI